jgi:hypothetical protein
MDINLGNERIVELQAALSEAMIRERALAKRIDAFGHIAKLFQRPKPEDISISCVQKRLEPFWYGTASARYVYDRHTTYRVEVMPEVEAVAVFGNDLPTTKEFKSGDRSFELEAIAHCVEEPRVELMLDASEGHDIDARKYLNFEKHQVSSVAELQNDDVVVIPPEIRGSFVVRKLTGLLMKTFQADRIDEERIDVDEIILYYRPLYAVEFEWAAKQKKQVYEFDALTGEVKSEGGVITKQVARVLDNDILFDVGSDTVGMIVPGANIAIKLGRFAARKAIRQ